MWLMDGRWETESVVIDACGSDIIQGQERTFRLSDWLGITKPYDKTPKVLFGFRGSCKSPLLSRYFWGRWVVSLYLVEEEGGLGWQVDSVLSVGGLCLAGGLDH